MGGGDSGCKEDDGDRESILQSENDIASSPLPFNGAQYSEKEDEEDDEESVLLKDQVFRDFCDSFFKDGPPTLGLKLAITSQLLDRINTELSVEHESAPSPSAKVNFAPTSRGNSASQSPPEKWKAANFQAKELIIGEWNRVAEVPNDLVVKIYYAKRKLIWEIMYNRLKNKIELQWADIAAFKAYSQADGTEVLEVELSRPPQFFHEPKSNPRSHTQWRATQDFTHGEALKNRRHKVICAPGALFKDLGRVLECDERLNNLRRHDFSSLDSTFFNESGYSNDQFQTISPLDLAQRPATINSELDIQQTTALPVQLSDVCINIQAGENPRNLYMECGMPHFPDNSLLGNSFGDCNVQFRNNCADSIGVVENYADDFQEMNCFGNNGQVMNPATLGNNIFAAMYYNQGAQVPSFSGYEYLDHQRHSSERVESMEPFVDRFNGGNTVILNNGGAPHGTIPRTRIDQVLQSGQNLNGSEGLVYGQNFGISPPVINHNMLMPTNYQNNITCYPPSTPNLVAKDPTSANFNPWDILHDKI